MIQFLRKIRQRLLSGNQFSKYLLYAIGEIALVVIGILIALQINTWSEEKKDRKLEAQYLLNLKKELVFNIQLGKEQISFSDFQRKNAQLILDLFQGIMPRDPMEMAIALEHVGWNHEIIFVNDVWNELYATGNIGIIRNEEIKNKLTDLYNLMRVINKFQEHEWSSYNFGARGLLAEVLPPSIRLQIDENLVPASYTGESLNIPNLDRIITEVKAKEGLQGYLVDIIQTRRTSNGFIHGGIEEMQSIILLIDQESD